MLKMKKILSIALVVVMLLSTVAISSFAIDTGKTFGLVLESDKKASEIVPGAKVTVTLKFEVADFDNFLFSDSRTCLLYDSNVYTPDLSSRVFLGDLANYAKDATKPNINAKFAATCMSNSTMSDADKALYNSGVMQQILADGPNLGATSKKGVKITEEANGISVPEMSITFNVTGDAAAIAAGNINIAMCDSSTNAAQYLKQTAGTTANPTVIPHDKVSAAKGNILANMPSEPSYAVAKYKTQVKFTGDKTTAPDDLFQFRLTSVITAADFAAMNSNGNTIKSVGFIAANTGAADADAAKTAVEKGTALPSAWKAASTDYVSQASASSDAYFGAIIKNISHASQATDIDCIAYVCYNDGAADHYVWYSAAVTAKVASGYDAAVANWKAQ